MKNKLFILDGTALLYRAHFAFIKNPLINSRGQHTSALYGTVSSFLKIYDSYKPEFIAVTFDRKEPTFRHSLYSEYKANRPPMPVELISQIKPIHDFFDLAKIKELSIPGYEADDIIGSIAKRYEHEFDIVIVGADKDFSQLVNAHITLLDQKNNVFLHENDILEKYEITPAQFIDYLALIGDTSDNIPGAKGIGPKTAVRLLHDFQNLENIYANIDKISNAKEKEKLITSKENVFLSRTLATIKTDITFDDVTSDSFKFDFNGLSHTIDFLESYELKNLTKSIKSKLVFNPQTIPVFTDKKEETSDEKGEYKLIKNTAELHEIITGCTSTAVAIDTETTSTDTVKAEIVGISFCFSPTNAYYIPLNHIFAENMNINEVVEVFCEFLKGKIVIGHNIKYDMYILSKYGLNIENIITDPEYIFDTMVAAYLLDPGKIYYSLTDCVKREFNHTMTPISDLIGKGKKQISFASVDLDSACKYSAEDSLMSFKLFKLYSNKLKELKLHELYHKIEIPLIFVLGDMEKQGVNIDVSELKQLEKEVSELLSVLIKGIHDLAGENFNINSPQQLSQILFEKMGIDPVKKTKEGFSTDIEVLETLAEKHEIAKLLIEYRHLVKMKNTYIETLPELVNPITKRVHSSFNQTITSTGRLSSSNPNLQNIPIKSELGQKIRKAISAPTGKSIISADYSQIELRLLACLSDDPSMIWAFENSVDIHTNTAAIIFKKDKNEIDSHERRKAKVINFGILYGMGSFSLSKELSISTKEAKEFIENYFNSFPTIKSFIEKLKFNAHQNGYVETIYGRRLYLPELRSPNARNVAESERIAVNMPIQGSAADIIKIAMINIYKRIKDRNDIKMLIQVHDELVFEVEDTSVPEARELIKYEMENALLDKYKDKVRLVVDISSGNNWAEKG